MPRERKVAYLDWSGDPGGKQSVGLSENLIVAVVVLTDTATLAREFASLRIRLHLPPAAEFRFTHASRNLRAAFFEAARRWDFAAGVIVSPKPQDLTRRRRYGLALIGDAVGALVTACPPKRLAGVTLIVDATGNRSPEVLEVAKATRRALRNAGLKKGVEVKGRPAHRENGLQLADMLAGAVAAQEAGRSDYVSLIGTKVRVFHR